MPVETRLSDADAAVLDAMLSGEAVNGDPARERAVRGVLDVLALGREVASPNEADERLIQATLARVASLVRSGDAVLISTLCDADAAALDAVVDNRGQAGPVPPGLRSRTERVRAVLSLLEPLRETGAEADPDDLIARTLQTAADARQRERFAQQVQMFADPPRTIGVGWRQLATAAAVFLLGFSLLFPVLDRNRADAQRTACAANLATAGMGFSAYAGDNNQALPRGPVRPGDSWTQVGQPAAVSPEGYYRSNSAHLYLLIRLGYVSPEELACASNDQAYRGGGASGGNASGGGRIDWNTPAAVSYSYQNQYSPRPIRLDRTPGSFAVLADKNPLFIAVNGRVVYDPDGTADAPTRLHRGEGQNVLSLDGRVRFTAQPRNGDDQLWVLAGQRGVYRGDEHPDAAGQDSFLVP